MVEATLRELNPLAQIVPATHGALRAVMPRATIRQGDIAGNGLTARPDGVAAWDMTIDEATGLVEARHFDPQSDPLGFATWSTTLPGSCDPQLLQELLEAVADGAFGQIERVKGVVRSGMGWVRFDCSGGRPNLLAFAAGEDETPRLVAVGREIDRGRLQAAFAACTMPPARMNRT